MNENNKKRDDLVGEIIEDYEKKEHLEVEIKEKQDKIIKRKHLKDRFLNFLIRFLVVFFLIQLAVTFIGRIKSLTKKTYWVAGRRHATDYKVDEGIKNLWKVRRAVDEYYKNNKNFPRDLNILYEKKYLKNRLLCPVSGNGYNMEEFDGKQSICCPNPREHGLSVFCIYLKSGPPIIKRR